MNESVMPVEKEVDASRRFHRLDVVVGFAVSACVSVLLASVSLAVRIQTSLLALKRLRSTR